MTENVTDRAVDNIRHGASWNFHESNLPMVTMRKMLRKPIVDNCWKEGKRVELICQYLFLFIFSISFSGDILAKDQCGQVLRPCDFLFDIDPS